MFPESPFSHAIFWRHRDGLTEEGLAKASVVFTAYLSIQDDLDYVSMPITSGMRLYDALLKHGVKTAADLKPVAPDALLKDVIEPNMREAMAFVAEVRAASRRTVLAPAVFEGRAQRWTQHEYMWLWLHVLAKKVRAIHMLDGWPYSNGGLEELVMGTLIRFRAFEDCASDVRIYDHLGNEIRIVEAARLIAAAAVRLRRLGFEPTVQLESLEHLAGIADFLYHDHMTSGSEYYRHLAYEFDHRALFAARAYARGETDRSGARPPPADNLHGRGTRHATPRFF